MMRIGKLGLALAMALVAGLAAAAPAAAQPAVLEAGKDCQKFRTCDYRRGGTYLGCRVSYVCKACRFVPANCTVDGERKVCQRLKCGFGPVS